MVVAVARDRSLRAFRAAAVIFALASAPTRAAAWAESVWYRTDADLGGAGDLYFTGTEVDQGMTCAVCHIENGEATEVSVRTNPSELAEGRYVPGVTYEVAVELLGETRGADLGCSRVSDSSCDQNGFAARVVATGGTPAGRWCAGIGAGCGSGPVETGRVSVSPDHSAVVSSGGGIGTTRWSATWTAPEDEPRAVSLVVVVVDGDGGDGTFSGSPLDIDGDGFAAVVLASEDGDARGCSGSPGSPPTGALVIALLLLVALRRRGIVLVVILFLGPACAEPPPARIGVGQQVFATEVQPVLAGRCQGPGCHDGPRPAGNLDVSSIEALAIRADVLQPWGPYRDALLVAKVTPPPPSGSSDGAGDLNLVHPTFFFSSTADPDLQILRSWTRSGAIPISRRSVLDGSVLAPFEIPAFVSFPVAEEVLDRFRPAEQWLLERCTAGSCHQWTGGRLILRRGSPAAGEQARQNYWIVSELLERGAPPQFSQLVRKMVPPSAGGLPHAGGGTVQSFDELKEEPIWAWVEAEAGDPPSGDDRSEEQRTFEREVHPVLVRRGCFFENCHGPAVPNLFRLRPGVLGEFSALDLEENYRSARAMLAPGAAPEIARLLRKPLALDAGGFAHGAIAAFAATDDPDFAALLEWAQLEAEAAARSAGVPLGEIRGIVYLRLPEAAARGADPDWRPGGDLWLQPAVLSADGAIDPEGLPVNLSASAHAGGPADVREPAVRPDGAVVAFAMRTSEEGGFDLYEVDLATRAIRRLTTDAGSSDACRVDHRDPAWAPDGTLVFVSSRGCRGTTVPGVLGTQLYRLAPGSPEVQQLTWSLDRVGTPTVRGRDSVVIYSRALGSRGAALFEVGLDGTAQHSDHLGNRLELGEVRRPRVAADGSAVVALAAPTPGGAGEALLFDRGLGVASRDAVRTRSLEWFDTRRSYRSLEPLPDGTLVVSAEDGDGRFVLGRLGRGWDSGQAASFDVLQAESGQMLVDAVPVWVRSPSLAEGPTLSEPADPGQLLHHDFRVTDALLASNDPVDRSIDSRVAGVRIVAIDPPPAGWSPDSELQATLPGRVLLETLLEPDGSAWLEVPLGTPFFVQSVDGRGRALRQRRWNEWSPPSTAPGGGLRQDVPRRFFEGMCGTCHGALSGRARDVVVVDTLTGASRAIASGQGRSPVSPRDAPRAVGWLEDVWPIVDRRCASAACHGEAAQPVLGANAESALDALQLAESTAGGWLAAGVLSADSPLLDLLDGAGRHVPELTDEETSVIALWVDLGRPWSRGP